jgi:molecular chaperone DnaK
MYTKAFVAHYIETLLKEASNKPTPRKTGDFFGIDFGTTNTAVYMIRRGELGITSMEQKLGENGEYPFPSILAVPKLYSDNGIVVFGRGVREQRMELGQTHDIIFSMKSHLGKNIKFNLADRNFSAVELTWAFLDYVKQSIKSQYGYDISEAAFSFPLEFSREARRDLKRAANAAGIKVTAFLNEGTAAYIANIDKARSSSRIMIIDFGGGTLDVNILEKHEDKIYEIAVESERIGGDDIDLEIARRVHPMFSDTDFDNISAQEKDQIIMSCERAKIGFTDNEEWPIELKNYGKKGIKTKFISYDWFKDVINPIINDRVVQTIYRVMGKSRKSPKSIDSVIIVGGSINLRPFQEKIFSIFGSDKIIKPNSNDSQWSVARGAALMQFSDGEFLLGENVCVELNDNTLFPLIEKDKSHVGTTIDPISFKLVEDAQSANFMIKDGLGNLLKRQTVKTKGFLQENLVLGGTIDDDQIAELRFTNNFMGDKYSEIALIDKLNFYYDLSKIKEVRND